MKCSPERRNILTRLEGKVAVITGGSSGSPAAHALDFQKRAKIFNK
jgi:NADP-dependent 3-hydroxy acid dehydrogenase YdfG